VSQTDEDESLASVSDGFAEARLSQRSWDDNGS